MKQNNQFIQDYEIDVKQIIKKLWKEKLLIFSITLIFVILNFIYAIILSPHISKKIYTTEVTVKEPPLLLLRKYDKYLNLKKDEKETKLLISDYSMHSNLTLTSNLREFVEKNNELDEFKSYLKNKNIDINYYFIGKLTPLPKVNENINKYIFTFEKPLQGEIFLRNYIIFTKNKTEVLLKRDLFRAINLDIDEIKKNLLIAEKSNIDNDSYLFNSSVNSTEEYYRGSKILTLKLEDAKNLFNETKDLKLDYDPILEEASPAILKNATDRFASSIAMGILGLFCSLIIIYIKNIIKN